MKPDHIFFDLDRTLWDFDENSKQSIFELHQKYLFEFGIDLNAFYQTYQQVNQKLWEAYNRNQISKEALRKQRFFQTLQIFNVSDAELAEKLEDEYIQTTPKRTKLIEGTIETLDFLASKCRLHIITNGFYEVQNLKLAYSGILKYFDVIITADSVGINKPDPKIFKHSLKSTAAKPESSLMIGDDLQNDILPALSLKMQAIWYNPENKTAATEVISIDRLLLLKTMF